METKKLEKIDMDQLNEIRSKYQENNMQIGMISADEYIIKQQLQQIEDAKNNCFSLIDQLRQDEQKLIKDLEEKYGEGQINLEEGVFIPNA